MTNEPVPNKATLKASQKTIGRISGPSRMAFLIQGLWADSDEGPAFCFYCCGGFYVFPFLVHSQILQRKPQGGPDSHETVQVPHGSSLRNVWGFEADAPA